MPKRPRDPAQLAKLIVDIATGKVDNLNPGLLDDERSLEWIIRCRKCFRLSGLGQSKSFPLQVRRSGRRDGHAAAEHRMPSCPQAAEVEIAQMRDLLLQFTDWCSHDDHAARRGDFDLRGCRTSPETIR
jgi:hypothetical protein